MRKANWSAWHNLGAHNKELSLRRTLLSGQSFRWRERSPSEWVGVLGKTAFALREDGDNIEFAFCHAEPQALSEQDAKMRLRDYFYLDRVPLLEYYDRWGVSPVLPAPSSPPTADINKTFQGVAKLLPGLRLLRQDPEECLFSFICSQNNNVKRITGMIDSFTSAYGDILCEDGGRALRAFPSVERIARIEEQELRDLGFGYRAKYIPKAAKEILEREQKQPDWLRSLRVRPREEVVTELQRLTGVGPKVADCISLFSLDKVDLVPVDTHVWQITQRFMPSLRGKTLSLALYKSIGNFWREKFGEWAGWAHTVMFAAELRDFKAELHGLAVDEPYAKKKSSSKAATVAKRKPEVGPKESVAAKSPKKQRRKDK